jgi:hypothetical protein
MQHRTRRDQAARGGAGKARCNLPEDVAVQFVYFMMFDSGSKILDPSGLAHQPTAWRSPSPTSRPKPLKIEARLSQDQR